MPPMLPPVTDATSRLFHTCVPLCSALPLLPNPILSFNTAHSCPQLCLSAYAPHPSLHAHLCMPPIYPHAPCMPPSCPHVPLPCDPSIPTSVSQCPHPPILICPLVSIHSATHTPTMPLCLAGSNAWWLPYCARHLAGEWGELIQC